MHTLLGPLALVGAAGGFALFGVLIRVMDAMFTPVAQVSARMAVAAALLVLFHAVYRTMPRLTLRQKKFAIAAGIVGATEVMLFTYAILVTTLATTLFLLYATSLVVSVIAASFVYDECLTLQKAVAVVLTLVGITFYTTGGDSSVAVWTLGTLAALLSGVMYGVNNLIGKILAGADALAAIQYKFVTGAVVTGAAVYMFGEAGVHTFSWFALAVCLFFGVMLIAVNRLLLYGFRHADVNTASVILSLELVFAAVIGVVGYGEYLTQREMMGGVLILLGSVVVSVVWKKKGEGILR